MRIRKDAAEEDPERGVHGLLCECDLWQRFQAVVGPEVRQVRYALLFLLLPACSYSISYLCEIYDDIIIIHHSDDT